MTIRTTAVALLLAGCLPAGPTTSSGCDDCSSPGTELAPLDRDESCLKDAPKDQVELDLETIEETGTSYHEMVACGGLAFQVSQNLTMILVTSLLDAQGVEVPDGFVYDGAGGYFSGSGGTDMTVRYYFGDDFAAGAEDELVTHNLFDFSNYLRGVTATADLTGVEVHWNHTGPLVELLGHGANPPNPLHFDMSDLELPYRIGRLKMVTEIDVTQSMPSSTVRYTLSSEARRIRPMLDAGGIAFESLSSETINAKGSVLRSTSWGVGYNNTAGALDGAIDFELEGSVDLIGRYDYDQSSAAEVSWTCRPEGE